MLIHSKITTLQVVKDSHLPKPQIYLKDSWHSVKDTIPVIIEIKSEEPIKINNIGLTFKLYHSLTGILLKQYNNDSFVFSKIQQEDIKAILYINGSDIAIFYQAKDLDYSPNRINNLLYELDISVKTTQNISKFTDSGKLYLTN